MTGENTRSTSIINQILLLLMAVMLLYLIASFAKQVTVSREQQKQLDKLEKHVDAELAEQKRLEGALAHANSDLAVQEWVHENGWGAEGEVVIATVREAEMPSSDDQLPSEDTLSGNSPQDAWWDLFFGAP